MLDLAFQFSTHLASCWSQISVCLQWEFQPARAQPLLCVVEGCVRKHGWGKQGREVKRWGEKGTAHSLTRKWHWVIALRSWRSSFDAIRADKLDNTWSPSFLQGSPLFFFLHMQAHEQQAAQLPRGLRGGICNRKTPYQYILMTGDKWASSSAWLFPVHKSRQTADRGVCKKIGLLTAPEQT